MLTRHTAARIQHAHVACGMRTIQHAPATCSMHTWHAAIRIQHTHTHAAYSVLTRYAHAPRYNTHTRHETYTRGTLTAGTHQDTPHMKRARRSHHAGDVPILVVMCFDVCTRFSIPEFVRRCICRSLPGGCAATFVGGVPAR